jgi:hypothetical protein
LLTYLLCPERLVHTQTCSAQHERPQHPRSAPIIIVP